MGKQVVLEDAVTDPRCLPMITALLENCRHGNGCCLGGTALEWHGQQGGSRTQLKGGTFGVPWPSLTTFGESCALFGPTPRSPPGPALSIFHFGGGERRGAVLDFAAMVSAFFVGVWIWPFVHAEKSKIKVPAEGAERSLGEPSNFFSRVTVVWCKCLRAYARERLGLVVYFYEYPCLGELCSLVGDLCCCLS